MPFFLLTWAFIRLDSKGGAIYKQTRVGLNNKDFKLFKFRSMFKDAEKRGQLTVGMRDQRITKVGYYIRRYKLDELPQLFNVLNGSMSIVGPRPELRKYVNYYNAEQMRVLSVKPGITDFASIKYFKENELLGKSPDPEKEYLEVIMPEKLKLNLQYIEQQTFAGDLKIIFNTILTLLA
ncbi:MAG: sugar transferase [Sphingobacteriales bacterium]|jgi:lipopolysaccharide/colanic/teichoic acid biosynthesis glycosyltransferase|nr:sugar transferase [Sphingobacteriales bacterium]